MRSECARSTMITAMIAVSLALVGCDRATTNSASENVDRTVDAVAAGAGAATATVAEVADDAAITTKVKTALLAEPGLKSLDISVDTKDATVTLSGTVDDAATREHAKDVAIRVAGVRSVVDQITVKS